MCVGTRLFYLVFQILFRRLVVVRFGSDLGFFRRRELGALKPLGIESRGGKDFELVLKV